MKRGLIILLFILLVPLFSIITQAQSNICLLTIAAIAAPREAECNNILEEGEICDGNSFKDYENGINKCKELNPNKYTSGNLKCFPPNNQRECTIDTSECRYNLNAYIESHIDVDSPLTKSPLDGKVIIKLNMFDITDQGFPKKTIYTLNSQGLKRVYIGIYAVVMEKIHKDMKKIYDHILSFKSLGGFYGEGIILVLKQDGRTLKKDAISEDHLIYDLLTRVSSDNAWIQGNIIFQIDYNEDSPTADLTISQTIRDPSRTLVSKTASKKISKSEAESLILLLMQRFASYNRHLLPNGQIDPDSTENKRILAPDGKKIRAMLGKGMLKKDNKIPIMLWTPLGPEVKIGKKVEFKKIDTKKLKEHLDNRIQQPQQGSSQNPVSEDDYAFIGFFA